MLRKNGATRVDAYAPHGVFPQKSYKKLATKLDMLYTTDTIPKNVIRAAKTKNMEIISIEPVVEKLILEE